MPKLVFLPKGVGHFKGLLTFYLVIFYFYIEINNRNLIL